MIREPDPQPPENPVRLGLRPEQAAAAIGLSRRQLFNLTAPHGPIPCARIGTAVVYRIEDLQAFLARAVAESSTRGMLAENQEGDADGEHRQ